MVLEYEIGEEVEVCSNEEGYLGSYFEATIVSKLQEGSYYKVKYKRLFETEDDDSEPLEEIISAEEIRPMPPRFNPRMFRLHEKVDAFANDGWWVGEVTGFRGHLFSVYFATSDEQCEYRLSELRRHLEWDRVYEDWIYFPVRRQ